VPDPAGAAAASRQSVWSTKVRIPNPESRNPD